MLAEYRVILCDPPWRYQNWSATKHGAAKSHYPCMKTEEIARLPIAKIGAENCALLMWITLPKLVEGVHLPIMKAWNFRPVTCAFVWNKTDRNGGPYVGLGFYVRSGAEVCILGIRGKSPRKKGATCVLQVITAPRIYKHSRKPDEQYERIETLFEGPYLELFARKERPGWDCLGYEIDGKLLDETLAEHWREWKNGNGLKRNGGSSDNTEIKG